jgi:hypothetical protein
MRRQDKLKVIMEANMRLERDHLITKNIILEEVDTNSFESFIEKLSSNYKFGFYLGNDIDGAIWKNELSQNPEKFLGPLDKKNKRYEKEGYIYVGKIVDNTYRVWVSSTNKGLIKSIQDSFIKNYSKFTSGERSQKLQTGKGASVKIEPGVEEGKEYDLFFKAVADLTNKNNGTLIGDNVRVGNVTDYITKTGMEGKNLYVGLVPGEGVKQAGFNDRVVGGILVVVYNDDEVGKKVMDPLLQKFNKLTVSKTIKVMDPEQKEVKVTLITLSDDSITKKETNKGSVGTNAVSKILSRIVTKDDVELWTPQNPITVA